MRTRYYCSGWEIEKAFPINLTEHLASDIAALKRIVFLPSDFSNKEKIERNSKSLINTFSISGFKFEDVIVLNENMNSEEMCNYIKDCNVVFLMGGNPTTQLGIISSFLLEESLRKTEAVVMGMSAGAMCMSEYSMLLPVSEKYPNYEIKKGMNLSGISIYPHYNSNGNVPEIFINENEQTKKSDLIFASKQYGSFYLLQDNTEIKEQNGKLTFIGNDIILVSDGEFVPANNIVKKRL